MTIGPDFAPPDPQVNDEWQAAGDERVSTSPAETVSWWTRFDDPVLASLIEKAQANNPTLQIAGLRIYEARALLGVAVGALYPQIQQLSATAGVLELSEEAEPVSNLPLGVRENVDTSIGNYRLGFDAAWELDFWGRHRRRVESADAHLAATIATYDDVLVTLTGEVAAAYVLLRTLEERLTVAESNVAIQKRGFEISDTRNRNQLTSELDPQLARALLRDTQATVPQLHASIRQVKNAISVLLGRPPGALDGDLGPVGKIPSTPLDVTLGVPSELLRRRPDVRRAELQAAAQSARIGIAKTDLLPAFSLVGSIGYSADSVDDLFGSNAVSGFGLLNFRWNIFNYGRIRNLVRVEDARFQQLMVAYEDTVLRAAREVEDSMANFIAAQAQIGFLEDGAKAATRASELAMIQYRDGVASYDRVLQAQGFLLAQEDQLAAARGRVATSLVAIYKALGGGWEQRSLDELVSDEIRSEMSERTNWGDILEPGEVEPVPEEERGRWRLPDH